MQCVAIYSVCHEYVFGLQIMYCVECFHVLRFCLCFRKTKTFDFISPTRKILKGKYATTNCQIILNAIYPKSKSNGRKYCLCNSFFFILGCWRYLCLPFCHHTLICLMPWIFYWLYLFHQVHIDLQQQ